MFNGAAMSPRFRYAFTLACIMGLLPLSLTAQQGPDQTPAAVAPDAPAPDASAPTLVIRSSTRIVNLPVVVRDKHGKIIKNLQKDDLILTEDGQPQTIRYFDQDTAEPLTLGLLVDVSSSLGDALDVERSASKDFLHHMLGPQDTAFIVQFGREVDLLSHPTGDRATLQAALAKIAPIPVPVNNSAPNQHHGGTHLYDAVFLAADEVMKKQMNRKALILLTDGEDTSSKESLEQCIEAAQRADTIVYAIYYNDKSTEEHHTPHPIHVPSSNGGGGGGHGGGGHFAPASWEPQDTAGSGSVSGDDKTIGHRKKHADGRAVLTRMATETGGEMYEVTDKQSITDIYKMIDEELHTQYRLGYTPPAHTAPGYHLVSVVDKNSKYIVRTRSGYYSAK